MADYGLIVTLPGYDVADATPEQCAIHTKYNSPKIDATKDHFVNLRVFFANEPPDAGVGSTQETILYTTTHGYNYTPQIWLHCEYTSNYNGSTNSQFGPGEAFIRSGLVGDAAYVGVRAVGRYYYVYIRKHRATNTTPVLGMSLNLRLYIFAETAYS